MTQIIITQAVREMNEAGLPVATAKSAVTRGECTHCDRTDVRVRPGTLATLTAHTTPDRRPCNGTIAIAGSLWADTTEGNED